MKVLVDTTVWIDFFRGVETEKVAVLEQCIQNREDICCCGFGLTEVLQGIRGEKELATTKLLFDGLIYLEDDRSTFELAATIYRELRRKGSTIRNSIDCLIAAVVVQHGVMFLENDRDYQQIDRHYPLNRRVNRRQHEPRTHVGDYEAHASRPPRDAERRHNATREVNCTRRDEASCRCRVPDRGTVSPARICVSKAYHNPKRNRGYRPGGSKNTGGDWAPLHFST